ncbi:MAG TPA: RNA polymerase sigma factor RpoD/SigA [bacterium]|nr:RNA polymerase sigma factor RpoD/SigA [bacterium]
MEKLPFVSEEKSVGTYLREIARVPLLTPEQEKKISKAAQKGDEKALNRLIEANLRFVVSIAKGYRNRGLSFLDLINEGNLGLMKAARTFDPERGVRFVSYAVWWIRQSILAAILDKADMVRIPQSQSKKIRRINKQVEALREKTGGPVSDMEVMKKADINRETLDEVQQFAHGYLSLDTTHVGESEKPIIEFLANPKEKDDLEKTLMDKDLSSRLQKALGSLDQRDGKILTWRYGLDGKGSQTLDEIGKRLKISKERVRQIEERAMKKIRGSKDVELLRDFVA